MLHNSNSSKRHEDVAKVDNLLPYALLAFPLSFAGLPLAIHLPKYYTENLESSIESIGILILLARLFDSFLDPWIGIFSDKHNHVRRWIYFISGSILSICFLAIFTVPIYLPDINLYFILPILILTYVSYSFIFINFYSQGTEFTKDYRAQNKISGTRELFILLGIVLGTTMPNILQLYIIESLSYQYYSLIFVILLFIALYTNIKFSPKSKYVCRESISLGEVFRIIRNSAKLKWLLGVIFFNSLSGSVAATMFLFFVEDYLGSPDHAGPLLFCYFLSGALMIPMWIKLANKYGKRRTMIYAMFAATLIFFFASNLTERDLFSFYIIAILTGMMLGADFTIPPSLLADIIHENENISGVSFGITNFISKLNLSIAAGACLLVLSYFGYKANGVQSTEAKAVILMLYTFVPCTLKFISMTILYYSPIDRRYDV